jgi:hypothetical protein
MRLFFFVSLVLSAFQLAREIPWQNCRLAVQATTEENY